ncbi:MAG: anaerobic ribonucleoside-triphosphate reductase activating protein [Lachnospiraceae bacterium]|nr:anaerobic ribonucleoside-triphosphate reductase activating protein [Lachnospiraceae bacterium]
MNYAAIKYKDIANGTGVRTVLFVSGCTHHCEGCFQPQTWDFAYGEPFTEEIKEEVLRSIEPSYVAGLTLLGGEPMEPDNQRALLSLVREFDERFPKKDLWVYSGYTFETDILAEDGAGHCEVTRELLSHTDIIVDGEFVLAEKDITLRFRGSRNQRIIDVRRSMESGATALSELSA